MGVPVVDDEDLDNSDASDHLVIETMGLQLMVGVPVVLHLSQLHMTSSFDITIRCIPGCMVAVHSLQLYITIATYLYWSPCLSLRHAYMYIYMLCVYLQ